MVLTHTSTAALPMWLTFMLNDLPHPLTWQMLSTYTSRHMYNCQK